MENLTRGELLDLLGAYNDYVMDFYEEHDLGMCPVSIYEFYDNEYQMYKEEYNKQEFEIGDKVYNVCDNKMKGKVIDIVYDEDYGVYMYLIKYGYYIKWKKLWTFGCDLEKEV